MRRRFVSLSLLAAFILAGCGGSEQSSPESRTKQGPSTPALRNEQPPGVTMRLDRDKVEAGEGLKATMECESGTFLVGNPYSFERLVGDEWLTVPPSQSGPPIVFTLEGFLLRPGDPFETQIRVPPSLPVGRYRVGKTAEPVTEMGLPVGQAQQVSAVFRVVPPSN